MSVKRALTSRPRIVAAAVVARAPLVLPELTPFERAYYTYQQKLGRALGKDLADDWFFRQGSTAIGDFAEFDASVQKEKGTEGLLDVLVKARETVETRGELKPSRGIDDLKSLERKLDRTLYLLLKKDRTENAWQFPQGGVEGEESLQQAALRELREEAGKNMDVWSVGRVPASHYSYPFPKAHIKKFPEFSEARVFFMPLKIVRGQAQLNKAEGLVDFAWLTKEEIKDYVTPQYWNSVKTILASQ